MVSMCRGLQLLGQLLSLFGGDLSRGFHPFFGTNTRENDGKMRENENEGKMMKHPKFLGI